MFYTALRPSWPCSFSALYRSQGSLWFFTPSRPLSTAASPFVFLFFFSSPDRRYRRVSVSEHPRNVADSPSCSCSAKLFRGPPACSRSFMPLPRRLPRCTDSFWSLVRPTPAYADVPKCTFTAHFILSLPLPILCIVSAFTGRQSIQPLSTQT